MIETTGYGQMKVRKLLKSYVKAGRLIVGTAPRTGIHGKASIVPVYRIEE